MGTSAWRWWSWTSGSRSSEAKSAVRGRPWTSRSSGGAVSGPRRCQARRGMRSGRIRGARSGRWGDDGRSRSHTRRSASGHGDFIGAGGCSGGGVLDSDVADGNSTRRIVSRVLNIVWAGVIAARRVGGQVLNVVYASGSAARRFGRRVLDIAWPGGSAPRRFRGRILDVALRARRFGGGS